MTATTRVTHSWASERRGIEYTEMLDPAEGPVVEAASLAGESSPVGSEGWITSGATRD